MILIDEKDAALATELLRRPDLLAEICAQARYPARAVIELQAALWLFAAPVIAVESRIVHAADSRAPQPGTGSPRAAEEHERIDGEARWTVTEHEPYPAH